MAFSLPAEKRAKSVRVTVDGDVIKLDHRMEKGRVLITLAQAATVKTGQHMEIEIQC